ncbi:hypothetical protein N8198_03315 [Gammaproteobacteria bacterium]|nr:hypothetical protein [Gammaproteobacteria bacterium]
MISVSADCPLPVIGAGPADMSLVRCNPLAVAQLTDEVAGDLGFRSGMHGFQACPLAISPEIIDCLTPQMAVEKVG